MWTNNKYTPIYNRYIFENAYDMLSSYTQETPLVKLNNTSKFINKPFYIKDESKQYTNSFKPRGVSYVIINIINKIKDSNEKISFVTQSTGNHGIAMLYTLYKFAINNPDNNLIKNINPVIFAASNIQNTKLNKMIKYMDLFRKTINNFSCGQILYSYESYEEALYERIQYMNCNNSVYVPHASNDTIIGHGTIAIEIQQQLNKLGYNENTKICFFAACGAGGPVGIGACLKHIYNPDNIKFIIVQTNDQDALIQSLKQNKIIKNKPKNINIPFNFADGIAVDQPEENAILVCNSYADFGITVDHKECLYAAKELKNDLQLTYENSNYNTSVGGSTAAVYLAVKNTKMEKWIKDCDIVIMLGCEGNIDQMIIDYIDNL